MSKTRTEERVDGELRWLREKAAWLAAFKADLTQLPEGGDEAPVHRAHARFWLAVRLSHDRSWFVAPVVGVFLPHDPVRREVMFLTKATASGAHIRCFVVPQQRAEAGGPFTFRDYPDEPERELWLERGKLAGFRLGWTEVLLGLFATEEEAEDSPLLRAVDDQEAAYPVRHELAAFRVFQRLLPAPRRSA